MSRGDKKAQRQNRQTRLTKKTKLDAFIDALAEKALPEWACEVAQISHSEVYKIRKRNELFAARWKDAIIQATEKIELEIHRRAIEGIEEPHFYKGKIVGHVTKYSDDLLKLLAMAKIPEFALKTKTEITGKDGNPLIPETDSIALARRVAFLLTVAAEANRKKLKAPEET